MHFCIGIPNGSLCEGGRTRKVINELTNVKRICTLIIPKTIVTLSKSFTLPSMSKLLSLSAIIEDSTSKPTVIRKRMSCSRFSFQKSGSGPASNHSGLISCKCRNIVFFLSLLYVVFIFPPCKCKYCHKKCCNQINVI